ncbi:MAG: PIN domain-containing protein [Myxococcales bacterium]|nr:PIN domain-containing protein [Myxococcales bacterium]
MRLMLVDTSAWVLALQRKDSRAKERLIEVITSGEAAICPIVVLELLAGRARGEDPQALRARLSVLAQLECSRETWERAQRLASEARSRGQTLPAPDALVAAHALEAVASLLHADSDFTRIAPWSGLEQESLLP